MIILWISSHQRFIHRETGRDGRAEQNRDGIRWETAPPKTNRTHTDTKPISIQLMILSYRWRFSLLSSSLLLSYPEGSRRQNWNCIKLNDYRILKKQKQKTNSTRRGLISCCPILLLLFLLTDWLTDSVGECVCVWGWRQLSAFCYISFATWVRSFVRSFAWFVARPFLRLEQIIYFPCSQGQRWCQLWSQSDWEIIHRSSLSFLFLFL